MQKSPREFVEALPSLEKVLSSIPNKINNVREVESPPLTDELNSDLRKKKGEKRPKTSTDDSDDDDCGPDIFSALVGSINKLRKLEYHHDKMTEPVVVKPKLQLVKRRLCPVLEKLSLEEWMNTYTYENFNTNVEDILVFASCMRFKVSTEDDIIPEMFLMRPHIMPELCSEAATLKMSGAMHTIPTVKLLQFLNLLELNISSGDRESPISNNESDGMSILPFEMLMIRVLRAADACLICMYIMTSPNMPKIVYLEEVIDRVMLFVKHHLHNTIFPSFELARDERKRNSSANTDPSIAVLYKKVCDLVGLIDDLLNIIILKDTFVSLASSIVVLSLFVENVSELQVECLNLATTIFTRYKSHRNILLDDILASIARLSKPLNGNECIQMLTALVLQLTQCVGTLPETASTEYTHKIKRKKNYC